MTEQAWCDTVRMMHNRWLEKGAASGKKLSESREGLSSFDGKSQLLIIEHLGRCLSEAINVLLNINQELRAWKCAPVEFGDLIDQLAWFNMVYAEKSLLGLIADT